MRRKRENPYASEADLCRAFIECLPERWVAYPETAGWDILLVRADGCQIGVQAKLRLNLDVIGQAIADRYFQRAEGPDYRAVLVPRQESNEAVERIAAHVGFTILQMHPPSYPTSQCFIPKLFDEPVIGEHSEDRYWHDWRPEKRHRLPEFIPDVAAGVKSPIRLTEWKIKALRVEAILESRGYVTREDFRTLRMDARRWTAPGTGWLKPGGLGFVAGPFFGKGFKAQHPQVYAQLLATVEEWAPKALALAS